MTMHPDDITLAARVMTDVEPPTDLEARITARLDQEAPRPHARWRPAYWVGAAGLAATAALTLIVVQGPADFTVQGPTGSRVQGSIKVPESRGPAAAPLNSGTTAPRDAVVNRGPWTVSNPGPQVARPGPSSQRSDAELAWMSRRIPALEVIDRLVVERLTFESIQPEPMFITPLTMTPLVTSPVTGDPDAGRQ